MVWTERTHLARQNRGVGDHKEDQQDSGRTIREWTCLIVSVTVRVGVCVILGLVWFHRVRVMFGIKIKVVVRIIVKSNKHNPHNWIVGHRP